MTDEFDPCYSFFAGLGGTFILYGCGITGKLTISHLMDKALPPLAVCDGAPSLHGQHISGLTVIAPEEAARRFGNNTPFVVTINAIVEIPEEKKKIESYLLGLGVTSIVFLPKEVNFFLQEKSVQKNKLADHASTIINGAVYAQDVNSYFITVANGERATRGQPEKPVSTIFLTGDSTAFSLGVPNDYTTASYLQELVGGQNVLVRNFGSATPFPENILLRVLGFDLKPGDSVILDMVFSHDVSWAENFCRTAIAVNRYCLEKGCSFLVVLSPYDSVLKDEVDVDGIGPHVYMRNLARIREVLNASACPMIYIGEHFADMMRAGEAVFIDRAHLKAPANKLLASIIYNDYFKLRDMYTRLSIEDVRKSAIKKMAGLIREKYDRRFKDDIERWRGLIDRAETRTGDKIGAIVMNCNPFTNGHLHLIETASRRVDHLYVFVVEEDASVFPFPERIRLVREGTRHLGERVTVNPSGKLVLSSLTFGDYFGKEKIFSKVDPSYDISIFGAVIAPELGITQRFVGEEPNCAVTKQYNETMLSLLPPMGISVDVIPRMQFLGSPISASMVREWTRIGNYEKVKEVVPFVTYSHLMDLAGEGVDNRVAK